jgi:hypothetical protein
MARVPAWTGIPPFFAGAGGEGEGLVCTLKERPVPPDFLVGVAYLRVSGNSNNYYIVNVNKILTPVWVNTLCSL